MKNLNPYISLILLFLGVLFTAYYPEQSQFEYILIGYSVSFLGLTLCISQNKVSLSIQSIVILAMALRLSLVFTLPNLSDDIYRFLWDARLIELGIHPLDALPKTIMATTQDTYLSNLFPLLNSKEYFTIYPAVCQFFFWVSKSISGDNLILASSILKLIFCFADFLTIGAGIKILRYFKKPASHIIWYAFNPLIIIEGIGNLHFEIIMLAFVSWAFYFLMKNRLIISAVLMGAAIATKLLPLMFCPLILHYLWKKKWLLYFSVLVCSSAVFFLPLFYGIDISHFWQSIDLYFQKFEFNASIYYLMRSLGYLIFNNNIIHQVGPLLALLAFFIIIWISLRKNVQTQEGMVLAALFSFTVYLTLATTVHPWYLSIPIFLNIVFRKKWILLWSFAITLSYSIYMSQPFHEKLWLITIEYTLVVLMFIYEERPQTWLKITSFLNGQNNSSTPSQT